MPVPGAQSSLVRRDVAAPVTMVILFFSLQGLHSQGHSRIEVFHRHVHAVAVKPLLGDVFGDVGLVLVIGTDHLDVLAKDLAAEILHRQAGSSHGTGPAVVGIDARHVGEHTDLDHVARELALLGLRDRYAGGQGGSNGNRQQLAFHGVLLLVVGHQTPRYSFSISVLLASSFFATAATIWPCSMT